MGNIFFVVIFNWHYCIIYYCIICSLFRERFPYYEILPTDRGTPEFVHDDNTKYTPEELVAQLLAKAKDFAEISHGMIL